MAKKVEEKLLANFNTVIGGSLRHGNDSNIEKFTALLNTGMSVDTICNHMIDWSKANPTPTEPKAKKLFMETAMVKFFGYAIQKKNTPPIADEFVNGKRIVLPTTEPVEEKMPATSSTEQGVAGILNGVVTLVADTVESRLSTKIERLVLDEVKKSPKKEIVFTYNGEKHEVDGILHEKFEDVLFAVTHGLNVMLVGPAGSGKNVLCEQVAKAMGIPYRFTNAITYEHQLMGFTDANGVYHKTPFNETWTGGGLFDLDEADASSSEVFIKLNAALSGDTADFPAPIGNVKRHKDCYIIATANTYGLGADYDYVGRNVLDAASLNRFIRINIDYDKNIEEAMAYGDNGLLDFCREFRYICKELGIRTITSYRNIKQMAIMSQMPNIDKSTVIDYCLTAPMKYDDLTLIDSKRQGGGEWGSAFHKLVGIRKRVA